MNDTPAPPEESAATPERKRPRLNPGGADSARPIPSRSKPAVVPVTDEGAIEQLVEEVVAASEPAAAPVEETGPETDPVAQLAAAPPVELPPDDVLDGELEAEIEAAMAGDDAKLLDLAAQATVAVGDEGTVAEQVESEEDLEEGSRLKGTIQSVDAESVLVDIGLRATGIVPRRQWEKTEPEVGQVIDVSVDRYDADEGLIHLNLPRGRRRVGGDWSAVTVGMACDCVVTKSNKGGLEVSVGSLRGFLPAGQVDRSYVENLDEYIGQKLSVQVMEVDSRKRNLIVSRRALLEEERQDIEQAIWEQLSVGEIRSGTVKTLKDYGAFIDLGGLDGFLHIGEISWSRLNHPDEVLTQGQTVEVKVLSIDKERSRVSLGMRQLTQDPWSGVVDVYAVGRRVSGKVTRIMDFGAFVELEPGIEGLAHISELDHTRVRRVGDILKEGQHLEV
ncbi:MAG: S1 RNA-binding domain-containing protein, partial [Planctomycetaceae bacterium]